MATSEEVLTWEEIQKSLVTASQSSFTQSDLPPLIDIIILRKSEILSHEDKYENFFSCFVALSAHYIADNSSKIPRALLGKVSTACRTLMEFSLDRMLKYKQACSASQRNLMSIVEGLCVGSSQLQRSNVVTFTALIKKAKCPSGGKQKTTTEVKELQLKDICEPKPLSKADFVSLLMSSFQDSASTRKEFQTPPSEKRSEPESSKLSFISRNNDNLHALHGTDILLDVCLNLPFLHRYINSYHETVSGLELSLPKDLSDATPIKTSFSSVLNAMMMVSRVLTLPTLEVMTPAHLEKATTIIISCLYAAIYAATATLISNAAGSQGSQAKGQLSGMKEDDQDNLATLVVHKGIGLFDKLSQQIVKSTRSAGHHLQNLNMLGAWCVLRGLQYMTNLDLTAVKEKSRDRESPPPPPSSSGQPGVASSKSQGAAPSDEGNLTRTLWLKGNEPFNRLVVELSFFALKCFGSVLDDFHLENLGQTISEKNVSPTSPSILKESSAASRILLIIQHVSLPSLLLKISNRAYMKTCLIVKMKLEQEKTEAASETNSVNEGSAEYAATTEESSDDDSEPILGPWFEEATSTEPEEKPPTVPPPPPPPPTGNKSDENKESEKKDEDEMLEGPEKEETTLYLNLAAEVLQFLSVFLHKYNRHIMEMSESIGKQSLVWSGPHMSSLAEVITDMDQGEIRLGEDDGSVLDNFSSCLLQFCHGLLSCNCLPHKEQCNFLANLKVDPSSEGPWPLFIPSRTLAVFAHVFMAKLQSKEGLDEVKKVLLKFLDTLADRCIDGPALEENEVNVEHIQFLLLIFDFLNVEDKSEILRQCALYVLKISQSSLLAETPPLGPCRLLQVFEYLLFHFSESAPHLYDHVQWNIFTVQSSNPELLAKQNEQGGLAKTKFYVQCPEMEENLEKVQTNSSASPPDKVDFAKLKRCFYSLVSINSERNGLVPLDKQACEVLYDESFDYGEFYQAMIELQAAGSSCDDIAKNDDRTLPYTIACAMHYAQLITWRLLDCLAPSVAYLKLLEGQHLGKERQLSTREVIHTMRWVPRLTSEKYKPWIMEHLCEQRLPTTEVESLLDIIGKTCDNVSFDIQLTTNAIVAQLEQFAPLTHSYDCFLSHELPGFSSVCLLDLAVAKVQSSLHKEKVQKADGQLAKDCQELMLNLLRLLQKFVSVSRSCLMFEIVENSSLFTAMSWSAHSAVFSIISSFAQRRGEGTVALRGTLSDVEKESLNKWNNAFTGQPAEAMLKEMENKPILSECYLDKIMGLHLDTLTKTPPSSIMVSSSVKYLMFYVVQLVSSLKDLCPKDADNKEVIKETLLPLLLDVSSEYLFDTASQIVTDVTGALDSSDIVTQVYLSLYGAADTCIRRYGEPGSRLSEKAFLGCLSIFNSGLEDENGRKALRIFYEENADICFLLMAASKPFLSQHLTPKLLQYFLRITQKVEAHPSDTDLPVVLRVFGRQMLENQNRVENWLKCLVKERTHLQENKHALESLASALVKEHSIHITDSFSTALLRALIPIASQLLTRDVTYTMTFADLMPVMIILARYGWGDGHMELFQAAYGWLEECQELLSQKEVIEKMKQANPDGMEKIFFQQNEVTVDAACCILSYIADVLSTLKQSNERVSLTSYDMETTSMDVDSDWADEMGVDDEDSGGEDSDEDSLCNKLCTFTLTQKVFMNQHWYHCHTCKMVDGVGVCTICAKVCHKGHELSYAKYGSFFCDCGAKEDGSCMALIKRNPGSNLESSMSNASMPSPFSLGTSSNANTNDRGSSTTTAATTTGQGRPRTQAISLASPTEKPQSTQRTEAKGVPLNAEELAKFRRSLRKLLEKHRPALLAELERHNPSGPIIELLGSLMSPIEEHYKQTSAVGTTARAQNALHRLHTEEKTVDFSEQLMVPTLGSQEGAFENVRANFSGDQGQTIRQLLNAHMLHRVAMCCLASPYGRRQHLAVCHEKGRITVLQLSALLKQADSSKKKLTLTRLSSATVPFTVLGITGNPCNEDFLVVCGLKDCHVLTFTGAGTVSDQLVLHCQLEAGNFIIKALWLPGSQTELAIVTADFVKIYNLAKDAISPKFYFLVPSGKIRDACFIFTEESHHLVLMSSAGYMYTQRMEAASEAKHGPFYVTNVLEASHPDLTDTGGQVAGGGVSCYYSHTLQMLLFSYAHGKTFCAPVNQQQLNLSSMYPITLKNNGGKSGNPPPLCQWNEVPMHPGLVCALTQANSIPVVLMIEPDKIRVQEIKTLPAKSKVQDMVAIRHSSSSEQQRTTLILLCEDGSLRIYMANVDTTSHWMSSHFQAAGAISALKPIKKKKAVKPGRPTGQVSFPVDFFESCQALTEVEYGGNDLLQVYNVQQIKHRLNTNGMYVASTKAGGFSIDVFNNNASMVMVGVRVHVGTQSIERAPSYLEVFGRTSQVSLTRNRWFDMPFTREEALTADKKFTLFVGQSVDPDSVTMVDSIVVYSKTKETFNWYDEQAEEFASTPTTTPASNSASSGPSADSEPISPPPVPMTSLDKILSSSLEIMDGVVNLVSQQEESHRDTILRLGTDILTLPTPPAIQQHVKTLLTTVQPSGSAYHNHKDQALLAHVVQCLNAAPLEETKAVAVPAPELDPEAFQRLVVTARSVAMSRPKNLVLFADSDLNSTLLGDADATLDPQDSASDVTSEVGSSPTLDMDEDEGQHFLTRLLDAFWRLHSAKPSNPMLAPACLPGLTHIEITVGALVEIIYAFASTDLSIVPLATKLIMRLLISEDTNVSFAAKQALIRVMHPHQKDQRVIIPSPPRCSSPSADQGAPADEDKEIPPEAEEGAGGVVNEQEVSESSHDEASYDVIEPVPMELEGDGDPEPEAPANGAVGSRLNFESLLGGSRVGGFPPMLDIPPEADDEAMMELAIALSLQDQSSGTAGSGLNLQNLGLASDVQGVGAAQGQSSSSLETGTLSDTTASAASDDEGSTAATDGSTLRTSPAEHAGSAESESGASGVDSITGEHSMSGRSSAYGDVQDQGAGRTDGGSDRGVVTGTCSGSQEMLVSDDTNSSQRIHLLRLLLLERLLEYMPELRQVGGVRAIPYMQVILMLSSDLDLEEDKDREALDHLLETMLKELEIEKREFKKISERTPNHEVQLIVMRLLSVFMSRTKSGTKTASEASTQISHATASSLLKSGAVDFCLCILRSLLEHWLEVGQEDDTAAPGNNLLKPHPPSSPPDMSPFFLRQYVKGHAGDVFEAYPQLLTEMVLRLPYQIKKICDSSPSVGQPIFDQAWFYYLCEYMMTQQTPFVRRQVRKLLLFISGTKDKYRHLRDLHALESHLKDIKKICEQNGLNLSDTSATPLTLPYDTLIELIEHLKACQEMAASRTLNWQKFCLQDQTVLSSLLQASFYLDEGVASLLLQLLTCALCGNKKTSSSHSSSSKSKKAEKSESRDSSEELQKHDEALCQKLIKQVTQLVGHGVLAKFIRHHLLESNDSQLRWQAHGLVLHIFKSSSSSIQELLLDLMWDLWPELSSYGRKAAQYVDLLGYFSLKVPQKTEKSIQYVEKAASLLKTQNQVLSNHPNSTIYSELAGLVAFDGFYLESEPCLVCNNPEIPFTNIKLTALKVDSRYTANSQIVKLVGTHTISKIALRISDLKRTKMVRTVNIYYNNRTVHSVVDLKNKPTVWHKAKKCSLTAGQTEVKIEFLLPIVAANLMIEYADFYDNLSASAETLQCPRCSASVPANPGVCGNCGENVFQCHKCRAINYDEKDPFLCNSCGFCKYAKFDYTLTAKACCAVDPIENEEDRKKATNTINSLLEKADRVYRQLVSHRPQLEVLLAKVQEPGLERQQDGAASATTTTTTTSSSSATVNRAIQMLAQRYSGDCKNTFEELSKIIQKVLACRKELVEYDRRQREASQKSNLPHSGMTPLTSPLPSPHPSPAPSFTAVAVPACKVTQRNAGRCYGCAAAATEHCVTLLRALATNADTRDILVTQGLLNELVEYNLRSGHTSYRNEVRQLIFLLTKDNPVATGMLNDLIMTRISAVLSDNVNPDMASNVRYLMMLLMSTCTTERYDSCWEMRLKCIMTLFMKSVKISSPVVMENITLPCLKVIHHVIKPVPPTSKKNKEETVGNLSTVKPVGWDVYINTKDWLTQTRSMYDYWKQRVPSNKQETEESSTSTQQARGKYLMEKYARRWMVEAKKSPESLHLGGTTWLRRVLFSPSSRSARQVACNIVESICQVSSRRQQMLDLLTSYLDEIGPSGESAVEFITLYQRLISAAHWKLYLAAKGVLPHIADLITKEIEVLSVLESTTLTSDLSQGYALKMLTNLLSSFLEVDSIRRHYKSKLLGPVLHGYLALRKLIVQRTKLIDETQQMLLDLLEDMTTGTESETGEFMAVCVDTVKRYGLDDLRTPVFIFERLCSIIYPEENEVGEFFMTLEKDPQQEDFLQGRMQGNPYSSNEPDLGPTMRDVKNKICRDCELIALLEDDTGMELLVNNKIMSLDLPVKEVYKKIWCPDNEGEPMRIIYRMRGLLGDATEEFIENLNNSTDEEADDEEVYKMAGVMSTCEGLEVILYRLAHLMDLVRGQQLLTLLLKLLGFCVKVKVNRQQLIKPKMQTVNIMMAVLNRVLLAENENAGSGGGSAIAEQVLTVMEVILLEAINEPTDKDKPQIACDKSQLMALLDRASSPFVRSQSNVLQGLMRIIPFLSFGDYEKMQMLVKYFKPYIEFEKFDDSHTQDEQLHLECFCAIAAGIEKHSNGDQLKDLIIDEGIVDLAVLYVINKLPDADSSLDSQPWKDFLAKPSLPFVLRLLSGLCKGHAKTQQLVGNKCIPAIHRLEQISSEEGIGSLAENLMEALKTNPEVAKKIDEVRAQTKAEKKRRAMAMRKKQLGALGMSTNEKGQVTASRTVFQQMEDLVEESGLTCCICREGYKYQSQKVLGIYTYTKVAVLEPFELKSKKTQGYSTVSHFNIVHYDCHLAAVRHARGRDEWESAVLQNANTKCNGLLPLWGPNVPESAFASCLARHNVYLPECSGYREPTYHATLHDLKLLLLRYVQELSFSSDSGGGGRQSNMHLIPYMIHMALYVINTTRCVPREEKNLTSFLKHPPSKWVELSYELDGPHYYCLLALHIFSPEKWEEHKLVLLKQLLVSAQARTVSPGGAKSLSDKAVKDYGVYKGALMYFGLIEILYSVLFKDASKPEESWSQSVANYVRNNDEALIKNADKVLSTYEKDFQPCESFTEFCDVDGLLGKIPDPDKFLLDLLRSVS